MQVCRIRLDLEGGRFVNRSTVVEPNGEKWTEGSSRLGSPARRRGRHRCRGALKLGRV